MPLGILFWILMLLYAIFGVWPTFDSAKFGPFGGSLALFVALCLLGWQVFGPALYRGSTPPP